MALNAIKRKLYDHLETLALPAGVTIHYPNISATVPDATYLVPNVLPNTTRSVDLVSTDRETGLLQIVVYVKKGAGELVSADVAQVIISGFSRNLDLDGVRIDVTGSVGPSFFDDGGWSMTPVTVPYINID